MKKRKKMKLAKNFKILLITILIISGFLYFNKGENEEYLINAKSLKSDSSSKEYIVDNIKSVKQKPNYPTGCESVSLYILLKHYNINVSIDDIIDELPKGSVPYEEDGKLYGPDPEKEFVGDPYTDYSYGVFEEPIKKVANKFKKGAIAKKDISIKELKNIIKSGSPLIAWTRIQEDLSELEYADSWISEENNKIIKWPKGEHAIVVYGYDEKYYYISNPINGEKYPIDNEIFEYNFKLLGSRVIYYE